VTAVADAGYIAEVGWQVIDQNGNVVDSGPGIVLEMSTEIGGGEQEGADDGGDRPNSGQ
jgi:hypothetical protein